MTSKNDITGDKLQTKPASDAYRDGFDRIFRSQPTCKHEFRWLKNNDGDEYFECELCGMRDAGSA